MPTKPQDFDKQFTSRIRDLKNLTSAEFAKRYGISVRAAEGRRTRMFGPATRPNDWWIKPEILEILTSNLTAREMGAKLGLGADRARDLHKKACQLLNKPNASVNITSYKPRDWWKQPETLDILTSDLNCRQIGEKLGIGHGHAARLRNKARLLRNIPIPVVKRRRPLLRPLNWWKDPAVLQILTSGLKERGVAEKLGLSVGHASKLRRQARALLNIALPHKNAPRPLNWWQEPEALQILTSNLTDREVADKLDIAATYVGKLRNKARIHLDLPNQQILPPEPYHTDRPWDWWKDPAVLEILNSGMKAPQVAAKLEVSRTHVIALRRKAQALLSEQSC